MGSPDLEGAMSKDRRCFSSWLGAITRQSSYESLWSAVQELGLVLNDSSATSTSVNDVGSEPVSLIDPWEKSFSLNWLTRLLSFTVDRVSDPGDPEHDWEALYSVVGHMMAQMTESSATSSLVFLQRTYVFDLVLGGTPSSDSDHPDRRIEIQLREGSPSYLAIGSQTWNSAPLLCRRLCREPYEFFPQLFFDPSATIPGPHPDESSASNSNTETPRRSLKVLELGSGTGLTGLTASHVLASILTSRSPLESVDVEVILTDYHPEVLANLRHNLEMNQAGLELPGNCRSSLSVQVMPLDWRKLESSPLTAAGLAGSFDVVLGSDLVYEPEHAIWASSAVQYFMKPETFTLDELLMKNSSKNTPPGPPGGTGQGTTTALDLRPAFHLLLPLRPTFTKESEAVHFAFGGSDIKLLLDQTDQLPSTLPTHSCKWESLTNPTPEEVTRAPNINPLKIIKYSREEGVKFGQGCGQYQYLQIRRERDP